MYRLVVTVRRGSASGLAGASEHYSTIEQARDAGARLMRHERVTRIAIVANAVPPQFVEWLDR